jgi:hypothetical protein
MLFDRQQEQNSDDSEEMLPAARVEKQDDPLEHKAGIIRKYSPALFKGWQRRHVVIRDHQLRYWKEKTKNSGVWDELCGVLNFDLYRCDVKVIEKDKVIEIHMHGIDRKFEFKAENEVEFRAWAAIMTH